MNQLMLIVVVLVAFIYFGGSNVPKALFHGIIKKYY